MGQDDSWEDKVDETLAGARSFALQVLAPLLFGAIGSLIAVWFASHSHLLNEWAVMRLRWAYLAMWSTAGILAFVWGHHRKGDCRVIR